MHGRQLKVIQDRTDAFLEQCNISRKHRVPVTQQRVTTTLTSRTPLPDIFELQIIYQAINLQIKIFFFTFCRPISIVAKEQ